MRLLGLVSFYQREATSPVKILREDKIFVVAVSVLFSILEPLGNNKTENDVTTQLKPHTLRDTRTGRCEWPDWPFTNILIL